MALARESADLVVVMVHGGLEYRGKPSASSSARSRTPRIDAGASLVLGHHPHVLQGYAKRGDDLIAFSLGNFVFARFDGRANDSAILDVTLTAGRRGEPRLDPGRASAAAFRGPRRRPRRNAFAAGCRRSDRGRC